MEVKTIVIIISVLVLVGFLINANRKKLGKIINKKKCDSPDKVDPTNITPFDSSASSQAEIKENYDNVRRNKNRVNIHLSPSITNRSTICSTDACTYCDPFNKQLVNICEHECKKDSCE